MVNANVSKNEYDVTREMKKEAGEGTKRSHKEVEECIAAIDNEALFPLADFVAGNVSFFFAGNMFMFKFIHRHAGDSTYAVFILYLQSARRARARNKILCIANSVTFMAHAVHTGCSLSIVDHTTLPSVLIIVRRNRQT